MNDLPELPFEKILSYLSLEDRLKCRAVSKRWYKKINNFKPTSLCYLEVKSDVVVTKSGKSRLYSGAFAKNLIRSPRFKPFFNAFAKSVLSSLKNLRLYDLHINEQDKMSFVEILHSFSQLEELVLCRVNDYPHLTSKPTIELELNLPTLLSIRLDEVFGIKRMTLNAPKLQNVKLANFHYFKLIIVHAESVEKLFTMRMGYTPVNKLKNLKHLYIDDGGCDSVLPSLEQLKEIHLTGREDVSKLFEAKQRYGRADLEVFEEGFLLNGPNDPAIRSGLHHHLFNMEFIAYLAKHRSRLADEIPSNKWLTYKVIERVSEETAIAIVSRFTEMDHLRVDKPVQDVDRFLAFLKTFPQIVELDFWCDQPRDLFDRLHEYCDVQKLEFYYPHQDFGFLPGLQKLVELDLSGVIDPESVRRGLEEIPFLSFVKFKSTNRNVEIRIGHQPKVFKVTVGAQRAVVSDVNAVYQFIEEARFKKRKATDNHQLAKSTKKL